MLFTMPLGLAQPWKVVRCGLEDGGGGSRLLYVDIEVEAGARMPRPECGCSCPLYDHEVKRWRQWNFWQHPTCLSTRAPRVNGRQHEIKQVTAPWARPGSGFTLMFEAFVMALAKEMPMAALADLVLEHDTRLWRYLYQGTDTNGTETHAATGLEETSKRLRS